LRSQAAVGSELTMLGHPTGKGGRGDLVAVTGFQFGYGLGKGVAEVIERDAVEDDAERIGFVAEFCRCGCEHALAQLALPQLHNLKLLAASAFADDACAAAMWAARGRFDGVRNAVGGCKWRGHIGKDGCTLPCVGTSRILEGKRWPFGSVERRMGLAAAAALRG